MPFENVNNSFSTEASETAHQASLNLLESTWTNTSAPAEPGKTGDSKDSFKADGLNIAGIESLKAGADMDGNPIHVARLDTKKDGSWDLHLNNGWTINTDKNGKTSLSIWDQQKAEFLPGHSMSTKNGLTTLFFDDGTKVLFAPKTPLKVTTPFIPYSGGASIDWVAEL